LQPQWKKDMQVQLVFFGIDRLDLEGEAQGAARTLPPKIMVWPGAAGPSGSTRSGWTSAQSK
jgi:hypothetical protein